MSFLSFLFFTAIGLGLGVPAAKRLLVWIEKILQGQRKMCCILPYVSTLPSTPSVPSIPTTPTTSANPPKLN